MNNTTSRWISQSILLLIYKLLLDFLFLRIYYTVYAYLTEGTYQFSLSKYVISTFFFFLFLLVNYYCGQRNDGILAIEMTLFMVFCVVPMLSVYACLSYVKIGSILFPIMFWLLLFFFLFRNKFGSSKRKFIRIPAIKQASVGILIVCVLGGALCWVWAGFPILLSLSDSTAQRIALRANSMPSILGYVFMILGGVLFPYLFVRYLDSKKYVFSAISLVFGFLLYSINGMKTWLFIYLFAMVMFVLCKYKKDNITHICNTIIVMVCVLLVFCSFMYIKFGVVDFLSQFGRVFCIPNGIGFKSINFFSQSDNPYLLLRESILRNFFQTPYPGGSDFYIKYGANITVASGRSNNGLWGDAYRNFGLIGIIVYPFFFAKIFSIINRSVKNKRIRFQIIVVFIMIWNSVNVSFFTWLITGGVVVLLVVNAFFANEDRNKFLEGNV